MNIPILGPLLIVLASSLWAVDALIRTPLTQTIPSAAIVFYEHVFGVVILIPLFFKSFRVLKNLSVKTWLSIILLAFVSSVGGTVFFTQALSASFATGDFITPLLLLKLQPMIVIGLSIVLLKEKISRQFYPFAIIAILGSYLMSFGTTIPSVRISGKELVVALSIAASFCWGLGTIISKTLLQRYSSQDATFLRFLAAIPVGFLVMILMNQFYPPSLLSSSDILRFIAIALSTGAVALLIYYAGLSRTHAHVSTIAELAFPLTSVIIGITSLNPYGAPQSLSLSQGIGILMVVIAITRMSFLAAKKDRSVIVSGIVQKGSGDGKKLGFPTANITLAEKLPLEFGVYAAITTINGKQYDSVIHYGPRIIFQEDDPKFEVHIFDFNRSLYGKKIVVEVKTFLRETQYFPSVDDMIRQIKKDCENARRCLLEDK